MTVTYNEKIELSVIASVAQKNENFQVIEDIVEEIHFWWRPFSYVWKAYKNLNDEQLSIDKVSLSNELKRNNWLGAFVISSVGLSGDSAINYLFGFEIEVENAETYAYELVEAYASRKSIEVLENAKQALNKGTRTSEVWSNLDVESGKLTTMVGSKSSSIVPIKTASDEALDRTIEAMSGRGTIIPTGLKFIDRFTAGLARKRVIMIAGGTGDGKTAMSQTIINQVSILNKKKHAMGWISLEMDRTECVNRLISNNTGIPALRLDTGKLTDAELELFKKWKLIIDEAPIFIDDSAELTYPMLKTKIRKMKELGCVSVVIDQLENMIVPPQMMGLPDFVKFNWGSYKIKSYVKEFDINSILLHQISREINKGQNRGKDVKPVVQDINGGGDKGVDTVFIIRRPEGKAYNNCVKNRQGEAGKRMEMNFVGERMRFEDVEQSFPEGFEEDIPVDVIEDYMENFEPALETAS